MRIGGITHDATNAYNGTAIELYFQGCTYHCKGCHNPQFQTPDGGNDVSINEIMEILNEHKQWFDIVSYLGGEPLQQQELQQLTLRIKQELPDKSITMFTGAELSEVPQWCFEYLNTIKTGQYIEALRQPTGLASSNQKLHKKGSDY